MIKLWKTYDPPIHERSNRELLEIAYSENEGWTRTAIRLAKKELNVRNIPSKTVNVFLAKKKTTELRLSNERKNIRNRNAKEKYKLYEQIGIFFLAPFVVFNVHDHWGLRFGHGLVGLYQENYKSKFWQRFFLLIGGFVFWMILLSYDAGRNEERRIQEIEKIDISDWKNRMKKSE